MPSRAADKFEIGLERATVLYRTVGHAGLRPQQREDADAILHAALAAGCAAWNFYVPNLIRDFLTSTANPLDIQYHALHSVLTQVSEDQIYKFNTPNADNARNLLISLTGYDPFSDWIWPERGLNAIATRERLKEILKVRHSFAHGFTMPSYPWTTGPGGTALLKKDAVKMTFALFKNLVRRTDRGMRDHLLTVYSTDFK